MADIRQTPVSNYPAYYGAGLLNYINEAASKPFGYENDPVRALTNLLGIPSAVKTLENTAYGMPNILGSGMATQLRPEAKETVGNLLPMAPAAARLAAKGAVATGKYLAPELGNMAEQYAARTGLLQSIKPIAPTQSQAMQAGSGFAGTINPVKPVNLQALANEAYEALKTNPNAINKQKYLEAKDRANAEFVALRDQPTTQPIVQEATDYKGQHTAPMNDNGKPLWDLTDIYPEDFYSSQGARYYGHGEDLGRDTRIVSQIQSFRNQPNRLVTVYRAVPKDVARGKGINIGDWITTDLKYAKEHGQSALNNDFKIVKKTVRARDIFTNGDSIYEFGYDPQPYVPKPKNNRMTSRG